MFKGSAKGAVNFLYKIVGENEGSQSKTIIDLIQDINIRNTKLNITENIKDRTENHDSEPSPSSKKVGKYSLNTAALFKPSKAKTASYSKVGTEALGLNLLLRKRQNLQEPKTDNGAASVPRKIALTLSLQLHNMDLMRCRNHNLPSKFSVKAAKTPRGSI